MEKTIVSREQLLRGEVSRGHFALEMQSKDPQGWACLESFLRQIRLQEAKTPLNERGLVVAVGSALNKKTHGDIDVRLVSSRPFRGADEINALVEETVQAMKGDFRVETGSVRSPEAIGKSRRCYRLRPKKGGTSLHILCANPGDLRVEDELKHRKGSHRRFCVLEKL